MKKFFSFIVKLAIIGVIVWWLKELYIEKIYNAPVAIADRLENASQQAYEQKLQEAEQIKKTEKTIIFVDACAGGMDNGLQYGNVFEKDVTLRVACELSKQMQNRNDVELFLTRAEDVSMSERQRKELLDIVEPDYYIRLELANSDDNEEYGVETLYSDSYYNYFLTNVEYAKRLEEAICAEAKNRAAGISNISGENSIWLEGMNVPSAIIKLGYISNGKEREALASDVYCQKLARGISHALVECIDNKSGINSKENKVTEKVEE